MNAFLAHLRTSFRSNSAYRLDCLLGLLSTCLQVLISCAIWRTLFGTNHRIPGISFSMVATNFVLAQGLGNAFVFNDFAVQRKLSDGSIAMDMLRPISFRLSLLADNLGNILFTLLTRFAPTVVIACLFVGIVPPVSIGAVFLFCISTALGFAVLWAISTVVQMSAFWIINVSFVNYFPAQFILRKQDMAQYPEFFMYITPIVGVSLYVLAYFFWKTSLRQYQSSGN